MGAVSYLNTKPLIYGFEQGLMKEAITLEENYPSNIAAALINDEIDIALLPVAIIPEMKDYHIVGDHCIACDGPVSSVCLFSNVPLESITTILLDYQSRTSVELIKILCKKHWNISPEFKQSTEGYENELNGTTAVLIIGDRALNKKGDSLYAYDLGQAWKELTGLPFVFAVWVSNKQLSPEFIEAFTKANDHGLQHLDEVINANTEYDLKKYYTENILYKLDDQKIEGLKAFLKRLYPSFELKIDG